MAVWGFSTSTTRLGSTLFSLGTRAPSSNTSKDFLSVDEVVIAWLRETAGMPFYMTQPHKQSRLLIKVFVTQRTSEKPEKPGQSKTKHT